MTEAVRILIIVSVFFGSYFVRNHIKKDNNNAVRTAIIFGILAVILALLLSYIAEHTLALKDPFKPKMVATNGQLITATMVYVVIEETIKFVPLALFLFSKKYFNQISDGVLFFGLTGLIFGSIEHFLYGSDFGGGTLLVRIFLTLFLHAGLTGMVGYFYAKDKILGNGWRTPFALLVAIALHFTYNSSIVFATRSSDKRVEAGLIAVSALIATGLNCLLVWLFYVASQADWKRLQGLPMPSPIGNDRTSHSPLSPIPHTEKSK